MINPKLYRLLNDKEYKDGPIVYWMSREHRVIDNWAVLFAQELAEKYNTSFSVIFCLRKEFPHATERLVDFMFGGLAEVKSDLRKKNISFQFLLGDPQSEIPKFIKEKKIGLIISDFHPLKPFRQWRETIAEKVAIPVYEVDSRNIIPCWEASGKQEFGAYTFRSKFHRKLDEYLTEFPTLHKQKDETLAKEVDFAKIKKVLTIDDSVKKVTWLKPGEKAAQKVLNDFLEGKFESYADDRNDPTKQTQSYLSSYLHFGHISAQRVVLELQKRKNNQKSEEAFVEELTVRRELADNYCYYNKNYDSPKGYPNWAQESIGEHLDDAREHNYTIKELKTAQTHDELWNAAMQQAIKTGIIHGYLRMYWAKKIFEWSKNPSDAQKKAIHLMDRYFLDGRETNGFTGIAWSMGGVHDRAWFEREVFGKIRYMSYNGAKSKFDIKKYIKQINAL